MYDYGLTCDDPRQRRDWLKMASQEGNMRPKHLLGQEAATVPAESNGKICLRHRQTT